MLINPFSSGHQGRHGHEFLGAPSTYLHSKEFKLIFSSRVRFSSTRRRQECICAICKQLQLPKWFPHPERKCVDNLPTTQNSTDLAFSTVCVSSLLIDEIKRIIKTSEIMKYIALDYARSNTFAYTETGKTMQNGPRRIRMDDRSWR
jgi:hypothetical protein